MVCRPATQFCCGCSVKSGVFLILIVHLLECIFVATMTGIFLIGQAPQFITYNLFENMTAQTAFAGFALAGIPIIALALWGAYIGMEPCLRIYLIYGLIAFSIDVAMCVKNFVFHPTCDNLPTIMAEQGRAWACGASRVYDTMACTIMLLIPGYCLFIIFSYCEDIAEGGAAPDLSDLSSTESAAKWHQKSVLANYGSALPSGRFHTNGTEYSTVFEAVAASGMGGNTPIFNGNFHELEYPPPHGASRHLSYRS